MPTRREFLAATTIGTVAASLHAAEKPKIPFGFSLYGMKSLSIADAVKTCAAIGYDGVEFALMPGYPTDPAKLTKTDHAELRQQLGDSGLSLLGLMENLREPAADAVHRANLDRLKLAFELAHAVSPTALPPVETVLGGKPSEWDALKQKLVDRLGSWAEVAASAKVVIAVKPHVGNALHTPDAAVWLVRQVNSPWLKLAYDPSHFFLRKIPLADSTKAMLPDTVFIHVKDATGTAEKFQFLLPGDGTIEYQELFQILKSSGYAGPIVVEVSGQVFNKPGYDPVAAARRCHAHLAAIFTMTGLR